MRVVAVRLVVVAVDGVGVAIGVAVFTKTRSGHKCTVPIHDWVHKCLDTVGTQIYLDMIGSWLYFDTIGSQCVIRREWVADILRHDWAPSVLRHDWVPDALRHD